MLSLTDPIGNTTSFTYDDIGRLLKETNALGKTRRFEYEGRLQVRKIDRNGRVTTFEHDDFGRVVAEKWFESDKVVKTLSFVYDAIGHLIKVDDGTAVFDYSRDEDGRERSATTTLPGLADSIIQQTEYDILGRRTQIKTTYSGNSFAHLYTYTKTGQVESISQEGKRVNYHYNASGMRTATQLFSQGNEVVTTTQAYDGLGRLTQIKHGDIAQYDYAWDIANRITAMNDAKYNYDNTSQLISAEYETLPEELYDYDANGNRKSYETGKNNQLLSDGIFDYSYDDEGNRISKVSKDSKTEYFWDHRNRLVRVLDNGKSVEYNYDHQNRLVRRNDELFLHDAWQIACSLRNGKIERRYLWGATQDELLAMDDAWTLRDHLNTVRNVIDMNGKTISHLEYDAFGKLISSTGEKLPFRYTGKMFDDTTGLQWNINRWYDPNVGRWISEDPIGFEGKDKNLYRYARNMPLVFTDVTGLMTNQERCDAYIKRWGIPDNTAGFVLCYYDLFQKRLVSCVNTDWLNDTFSDKTARDIAEECVMAHENFHINNQDKWRTVCTSCWPFPSIGGCSNFDKDKAECHAYDASLECLNKALTDNVCASSGNQNECIKQVNKRINDEKTHRNWFCQNAGFPAI